MNETTIVLPSTRAIRHEQLKIESSTLFLPSFTTMSDFISRLCIASGYKIADEDSRVLLLLEASDFSSFSKLQIQRNFFTFTKNSTYIFKFFEELSAELYDIQELEISDIYGEYEEHISILMELHKRYEKLCNDKKLLDKIFLPSLYKFNEDFIKHHKNIEIQVEGHLTNFEIKLLEKCCEFTSVNLIFNTTKFNSKMQSKFLDLGVDLEVGYRYIISLNEKEVIEKNKLSINKNISCYSFSESILQIAFIKQKVYEFIKKGISAENIAVILPDENMADVLKVYDEKSNFNFAMGYSFNKTEIYEKLNSTCQMIEQQSKENEAKLNRVGGDIYNEVYSLYYKTAQEVNFIEFLQKCKEMISSKKEIKIFEKEIHSFKNLLPYMQEMSVKSLFSIFLQRLASRTLDDVRGGKITVMGVLETRAVEFDAVIIVDFSDSNVPKRSDKDMFLNTHIREVAKLPTMSDRENLQKHYYEMLINRSKEVAISYVKSAQSSASRFLKQLDIKEQNIYSELDYATTLFKRVKPSTIDEKEIVMEYSFKDKKLSSTRLKTFLTCKRRYYYRYIKNIYSHDIPKDMPKEWEIGIDVHTALKELYEKKSSYFNLEELTKDLYYEIDSACGESELEKYLMSMQKRKMNLFAQREIERFNNGWKVEHCEISLETQFAGVTLTGIIDRVDIKDGEIFVLDYKTGSYPLYTAKNYTEATDFQLEFYYLLASSIGKVSGCGYYDLSESKIVNEAFLSEKLAVLESNIKDLLNIEEVNFSMCEDSKNCLFCEYATLCQR